MMKRARISLPRKVGNGNKGNAAWTETCRCIPASGYCRILVRCVRRIVGACASIQSSQGMLDDEAAGRGFAWGEATLNDERGTYGRAPRVGRSLAF